MLELFQPVQPSETTPDFECAKPPTKEECQTYIVALAGTSNEDEISAWMAETQQT